MSDSASAYGHRGGESRGGRQAWVTAVVVVATVTLNLWQQPGLITFDTKLDLQFKAGDFLTRSLSLWNGDSAIGGLQNQASGYLFPMGPAFWLGETAHIPMWVWERLWSAAIMLVAYAGVRRLAAHWPGIGPVGAVFAGLAYMLAPRVLTTVGGISGETLPAAILPWTVLPIALYLRGRLPARWALLWSAATIPWMGGQNATLVLACLVFPGLMLLLGEGRAWRRRVVDATSWSGLVVIVSLWWLVPLFLLGGYAPPFLNFIESSYNTASSTSWLTSLRGTSHWVAFFPGGGSAGWVGGYALASSRVLLITTVLVAGVGLLGLAQSGLWLRRVLVTTLLVGLTVLTLGTGGLAGSIFSDAWLGALDTWLAPIRNVHKFDPLVRLPVSLGLGAFVTTGLPQLIEHAQRAQRGRRISVLRTRSASVVAIAVLGALVLAAAQPAASGELRAEKGMIDISSPWRDAVDYLRSQPGPVSVLVLPGAGFAVQTWGRTVDEPIQVLGSPPWTSRSQSTVAPAGTLRLMDSIDTQLTEGRPLADLTAALRRIGITHVLLRNDLDPEETDAPPVELVYASIAGSRDMTAVAAFGQSAGDHPAVEVFALGGGSADARATVTDWSDPWVVQGGPEVVNDLAEVGLTEEGETIVLASGAPDEMARVITDSNRRVERSFGRVHDAVSGVMTAAESFRVRRPVHDYIGGSVPAAVTVAEYEGAKLITASSSSGYADILGPVRPEEHPYAAFDGSGFTAWTTAPFTEPQGQWIEVQFDQNLDPGSVDLSFDKLGGSDVASVMLTTDGGSETVEVDADGRVSGVDLPGTATSKIRMTVVAARSGINQVRLTDFAIEGHEISRSLRLPGEVRSGTSVYFASESPRRACVPTDAGVTCDARWQRETPETPGFDRTISVGDFGGWRIAGRAVATNGPATERLFLPGFRNLVEVAATSTFAGDPAVAAANAFDGRAESSWYSSPADAAPGLQLSWNKKRRITSVNAMLQEGQPGELPDVLVVDPQIDGTDPQLVATGGERAGVMTPVRTRRLRVTVLPDYNRTEGIGISELSVGGLDSLRFTPDLDSSTGVLCGFGPTVQIGGETIQTRLTGRLSDVVDGSELAMEPCDTGIAHLGPGTKRVRVTNPAGFAVTKMWLEPENPPSAFPTSTPTVQVRSWSPTKRTVAVDAHVPAVLALPQSDNRGWTARLAGAPLETVVVDGWKQGWLLPARTSGDVTLEFEPQATFRIGILVGAIVAVLLNITAIVTFILFGVNRRRRRTSGASGELELPTKEDAVEGDHRIRRAGLVAGAVLLALVSVPLSLGALTGFATRRVGFVGLSAAVAGGLLFAALAAVADPGRVITPPVIANVLAALVVGLVAGRVLGEHEVLAVDEP